MMVVVVCGCMYGTVCYHTIAKTRTTDKTQIKQMIGMDIVSSVLIANNMPETICDILFSVNVIKFAASNQ